MKKIASAFSNRSIPHRCMTMAIQKNSPEDMQFQVVNAQGRLFDYYAREKPDGLFMSILDYTQEVHDFIGEYQDACKIYLLMDKDLGKDNDDLWGFLCQSMVKVIVNTSVVRRDTPSSFLTYDNKYDETCFINTNQKRNDKIAIMSNGEPECIDRLKKEILYPATKLKVNVFNDVSLHSSQNLGMLDPRSLNAVMNEYGSFLDLTDSLALESQACGIKYLDHTGDWKESIEKQKTMPEITHLDKRTFTYFTEHEIIPYIRKNQ